MKRLLVLNFFPAFVPPSSGGEQRYYYIYHHLSRHYDISLLSPTFPESDREVVEFNASFREFRVPKDDVHVALHQELERSEIGPECSALVCALASATENEYHRQYRQLIPFADAVIHDSPFMIEYDQGLGKDGKPRIYNSYNIEADLMNQMLQGPHKARYVGYIAELEARLVRQCDLVFATSNVELERFRRLYRCAPEKLALAPNGFEPQANDAAWNRAVDRVTKEDFGLDRVKPLAVFLGSGHPPNVEAARYITEALAPQLPLVQFAIAGSVGKLITAAPSNVRILGLLSGEEKASLLRNSDLALNPMFSGAGTNLKMLDYMASGLSIVSTPIGARGLDVEDGRHCVVATVEAFVEAVSELVTNPSESSRLGRSARELAYSRYTWESIAEVMQERMTCLFGARSIGTTCASRRNVLVLNDFPASGALAGGEVRLHQLLEGVSQHHDVTLLCLTDDGVIGDRRLAQDFREITVPKTAEHREAQHHWDEIHHISVRDIVSATMCAKNALLVELYELLVADADVVILAHPYMVPLLATAPAPKRVIYEAYNVESTLKHAMLATHPQGAAFAAGAAALEQEACNVADHVVCVSEEDRLALSGCLSEEVTAVIIPNGVRLAAPEAGGDISAIKNCFDGHAVAIFIGSGHFPNIEAAEFIVSELAPACKGVSFLIVGSAGHFFSNRQMPKNVLILGPVTEEVKSILLDLADVALNPMQSGGGSSLKVPEYMAADVPIVTTKVGARGYDIVDGVHAIIASTHEFPGKLDRIVADVRLRQVLRKNAGAYVRERLDWRRLGATYGTIIEETVVSASTGPRSNPSPALANTARKRLLVVTYRFTDPPMGGAEAYLLAVVKGIHEIGNFDIDVATLAIGTIVDDLHFSATYAPEPADCEDHPSFVQQVHKFSVDTRDARAVIEHCRSLFAMWQREDLKQAKVFTDEYEEATLLGGWYYPERSASNLQRWTGATAEVYLPAGIPALTLEGHAIERQTIAFFFRDVPMTIVAIEGAFACDLTLPDAGAGILRMEIYPVHSLPNDPRLLGICISSITRRVGADAVEVPLTSDFGTWMRATNPGRWVKSLVDVTNARDVREDAKFLAVRGPHSADLDSWLSRNVSQYDVVLAQGVPFATSVTGVSHSVRRGVPCVVLPHFHIEDKYYHWGTFYETFSAADLVIAAPPSAKPLFFDAIGARSVSIPGGGIDPGEFENLEPGAPAFRSLHRSDRPFVLVLGRKSGAKNYGLIVDAVNTVNRTKHRLDMVMIGPEHDGRTIDSPFVKYYGAQPRACVLGALSSCLCLANMSDSESFGIVLLEAWMCRKPVVANRRCIAFADLVNGGQDGLLCETVEGLASAFEFLLENPVKARELGNAGYARASRSYAWAKVAESIDDCLTMVCARGEVERNVQSPVECSPG